ncbi:MAG: hypothetical protein APR53_01965 [Methanoculleus sp. SDB]|nr:MAG: hypothetical protein APR53_01965 [Methanoculleus sp. SDB]
MIEELSESSGNVLGFQFSGEITDDDYMGSFIPALRRAVKTFGTIRVLVDISDMQSEDFGAMDDDIRERERILYVEREAIVGDEDWVKRLVNVDHFFLFPGADVRFFGTEHRTEAWRWLREGLPSSISR